MLVFAFLSYTFLCELGRYIVFTSTKVVMFSHGVLGGLTSSRINLSDQSAGHVIACDTEIRLNICTCCARNNLCDLS